MKSFFALSAALVLGLTLNIGDAEAKRLGGGKSTGMQREAVSPQKAPPAATPAQTAPSPSQAAAPAASPAAAAAGAAQPKRSWMGPVAGLAAGLGLAALASHFGFGEELASMLMIGLAVMAVILVIGFIMRRRAAAQQPSMASANGMQYAPAGAAPMRDEPMMKQAGFATPAIGSGLAGTGAPAAVSIEAVERKGNIPADFDVNGFVRNAKVNFIRLQAANDTGNLDDIRDFTSPEMFAEIKMDIDERRGAEQQTDVLSLEAEVIEVAEETTRYVVSVRFTGELREEKGAAPTALDEVWHLSKPRDGNKGWVVAGIQQVQ